MKNPRKYEKFPGSSRFWCGGRLITGPDRRSFYLAVCFILVPAILTGGLTWPWLFIFLELYISLPLLAIFVSLFLCNFTFMFITAFRDPGIIPRAASPHGEHDSPWEYELKQPKDTKKLLVNGQKIRVKYCTTCNIYRTPRSIHCGVCDNCVDRFDHHCPWVGNCIGKRNYQTFLMFVWSVICSAIYSLLIALLHIAIVAAESFDEEDNHRDRFLFILARSFWSMIIIPYCFTAIGFVGFLGTFHCYLAISNQTTNEKIKGLWKKRRNPYTLGLFKNFWALFCAPQMTKYYVSYRAEYHEPVKFKPFGSKKKKKKNVDGVKSKKGVGNGKTKKGGNGKTKKGGKGKERKVKK
eukprot:TRINITY_DN6996_c0_g1_i1.p1 TRINITY_DN6996_c0_g1~~TRINITY_DN6996_c0_g1_i1.p1  ORF type:complete len:352 (-),score=29.45 TRINITY_DN6996_c0_g1_i1:80-1135(-)